MWEFPGWSAAIRSGGSRLGVVPQPIWYTTPSRGATARLISNHTAAVHGSWLPSRCVFGITEPTPAKRAVARDSTKVTFETLLASFGLDSAPALVRLGKLVHCLDLGGLPVAEALGIESLLAGLRASEPDDDALLARACEIFDWLLKSYEDKTT